MPAYALICTVDRDLDWTEMDWLKDGADIRLIIYCNKFSGSCKDSRLAQEVWQTENGAVCMFSAYGLARVQDQLITLLYWVRAP